VTGEPADEFTGHAQRFEAMDRDQLLAAARAWCFSCLLARDQRQRILSGTAHLLTSHERRLARLWALADRKKKTVPMDAFLKAFGVGVYEDQENDDYATPPPAQADAPPAT
jgi:hypothetical protein